MADQLGPTPVRASFGAIAGRIAFALALVMGVLVAIPVTIGLFNGLWQHAEIVLFVGVGAVGLVLVAGRVLRRR